MPKKDFTIIGFIAKIQEYEEISAGLCFLELLKYPDVQQFLRERGVQADILSYSLMKEMNESYNPLSFLHASFLMAEGYSNNEEPVRHLSKQPENTPPKLPTEIDFVLFAASRKYKNPSALTIFHEFMKFLTIERPKCFHDFGMTDKHGKVSDAFKESSKPPKVTHSDPSVEKLLIALQDDRFLSDPRVQRIIRAAHAKITSHPRP